MTTDQHITLLLAAAQHRPLTTDETRTLARHLRTLTTERDQLAADLTEARKAAAGRSAYGHRYPAPGGRLTTKPGATADAARLIAARLEAQHDRP